MKTREIPEDVMVASAEASMTKDTDRSSVRLKHLHDLQVAHKAADALFDHLTDHIAAQDATIRELRSQLADERVKLAEVREQLATERRALEAVRERFTPPRRPAFWDWFLGRTTP